MPALHSPTLLRMFILFLPLLAVQAASIADSRPKRRPEMDTNGFYGDTFSSGFGDFYTARKRNPGESYKYKRRPEMDTNGFYGDTFSSGFGDFYTAKKRMNTYTGGGKYYQPHNKRRPEMDTNGFYGDTFSSGFGDFYTAKRGQGWQLIKVPQLDKQRDLLQNTDDDMSGGVQA